MLMKPGIVPGRRSGRKRRIVAVTVRVSLAMSQINKIYLGARDGLMHPTDDSRGLCRIDTKEQAAVRVAG